MKWVVTSTEKDDPKVPRTITTSAGVFRVVVTRHLGHPGAWVLFVPGLFSNRELTALALPAAKKEAMTLLKNTLTQALREIY